MSTNRNLSTGNTISPAATSSAQAQSRAQDQTQTQTSSKTTTTQHQKIDFASSNAERTLHHEQSGETTTSHHSHHVVVETRPMAHKYVVRRPRALQYYHEGNLIEAGSGEAEGGEEDGHIILPLSYRDRIATSMIPLPKKRDADSRSTDKPVVQRKRLDLFIDLLWVGIVSNISERFTQAAFENDNYGEAFLEFLVLFLLAFEIWNLLRGFLNDAFTDDIVQRVFVIWILSLAMLYGNNTLYFVDNIFSTGVVLGLYLVARFGFAVREWIYAYFIPEMRRTVLWNSIMALPAIGLAVGAIFVAWPYSSILLFASLGVEIVHGGVMLSPFADRLIGHGWRKAVDAEHMVDRLESFFIIIIGEGVFLLIKDSPLGYGITSTAGDGVMVLVIYFTIFTIYFNSDQSLNYIHAVRRSWWGPWLWNLIHIPIFASILLLDASLLYLVQTDFEESGVTTTNDTSTVAGRQVLTLLSRQESSDSTTDTTSTETSAEQAHYRQAATWTAAGSLSIALLSMILMSLMNRSLDRPGTLIVNNRYIRLLPRFIIIPIVLCLPIKQDLNIEVFIAIVMMLLMVVVYAEFILGLEKGAKFFEPKLKTNMGKASLEKSGSGDEQNKH